MEPYHLLVSWTDIPLRENDFLLLFQTFADVSNLHRIFKSSQAKLSIGREFRSFLLYPQAALIQSSAQEYNLFRLHL